jgi:hypothetical protein
VVGTTCKHSLVVWISPVCKHIELLAFNSCSRICESRTLYPNLEDIGHEIKAILLVFDSEVLLLDDRPVNRDLACIVNGDEAACISF